jgi:hypothetical protein
MRCSGNRRRNRITNLRCSRSATVDLARQARESGAVGRVTAEQQDDADLLKTLSSQGEDDSSDRYGRHDDPDQDPVTSAIRPIDGFLVAQPCLDKASGDVFRTPVASDAYKSVRGFE